jgi:signal transduction histidine kinase
MRLPIRTRLTGWYVALLVLILGAVGAFVVVRLRADLTADVDRHLRGAAAHIARGYEAEGVVDFNDVAATVLSSRDEGAEIVDAGGRVVAAHGAIGQDFRVVSQPVERRGRHLTLRTGESLAEVDRSVSRVLVLLLLGGGAALVLTAAGGWLLARRALRPVEAMTAQADRIGAESLDRRLAVPPTRDEVAHLAGTLNAMLDRVDRGVEDKRRLVADASHELRGPLAVMAAELDVALADPSLDAEARPVLVSTREEVTRLARVVDDLLTLAAIDEGRLELVRETVDLRDLADGVAARAGMAVEGEHVRVAGDALRLEHAVSNLVDNALKFGGAGARLSTWSRGDAAGVAVSDMGPGVPEADRERIFERFVRLDSARGRREPGSGLGLAICREVAEAHGGRVWVEPNDGGGSRFCISLPTSEAPPGTGGSAAATDPGHRRAPVGL